MKPPKRLVPAACTLALLALASAGCPDTSSPLCPANTVAAGNFSLALTFDATQTGECRLTSWADGGPADAALGVNVAPQDSSLCTSPGDGGALLYLALATSVPRIAPLGAGGTFTFTTSTVTDSNSPCGCALQVDETISGSLTPASGTITYSPDGGLSPVASFKGTVVDIVDGGADCRCNVPCRLPFSMTGTKQ